MKKILLAVIYVFTIVLPAQSNEVNPATASNLPVSEKGKHPDTMSIVPGKTGEAQVRFYCASAGKAVIIVVDVSGKVVLQQQNALSADTNNLPVIDVLKLGEGMYSVQVVNAGQTFSSPMLIWK